MTELQLTILYLGNVTSTAQKVYYAFFHEQVLLADGILQKEDNYIILSHQPLLPRTTKTWIMHFNTSTQICIPYNQKTHIVLQEHLCKDNWIWDGGKLASEEELEVNPRSRSAKLRVCEKL